MSYKTGNNKHLVQTTLYQLSCDTRLETLNTLFKPHSINCHVIQDWQQQTPCFNHTLSIAMLYKTGNNRHLAQTTHYQLSCRTSLETSNHLVSTTHYQLSRHKRLATTDTLFKPHTINCHVVQDWQQQTPCFNHTLSIVMSYKNSNRHLVSTTHYQLSLHTKLETTDTIFKPHYQIAMSEDQLHNVYLRQP